MKKTLNEVNALIQLQVAIVNNCNRIVIGKASQEVIHYNELKRQLEKLGDLIELQKTF